VGRAFFPSQPNPLDVCGVTQKKGRAEHCGGLAHASAGGQMLDLADGGGRCLVVNGSANSLEPSHPGLASEKTGQELVRYWLDRCGDFMDQQRKNLVEREPSPREVAEHVDSLKFMIRVTLSSQALVADPDSPARRFAQEISGTLLQLQASLELFLNPMTDVEADTVLAAAFPNGSGT
jgi:hypothetical protein